MYSNRPLKALALLATLLPALTLALPGDRQQAIEIEAQSALREEQKGVTVYEGDVKIQQGSMVIKADKVTLYTTGNTLTRIVCVGTPAYYEQQPKPDGGPVIARANTIEYRLDTETIELVDNASLDQDGTTLNGERIDYDVRQQIIKARGGAGDGNERIRMVIPPNQQQGAE